VLHNQGVRFFPVVGLGRAGGYNADGHGNSVLRFHITWGTGPVGRGSSAASASGGDGLVESGSGTALDELTG